MFRRFSPGLKSKKSPRSDLESIIASCISNRDVDGAAGAIRSAVAPMSGGAGHPPVSKSALTSTLFLFTEHAPAHRWAEALSLCSQYQQQQTATASSFFADERLSSLIVRLRCLGGDADGAVAAVRAFRSQGGGQVKHRMLAPLIALCGEKSHLQIGLHLLNLCRECSIVLHPVDVKHFATILKNSAAKFHDAADAQRDFEEQVVLLLRQLADHFPVLSSDEELSSVSEVFRLLNRFSKGSAVVVDSATGKCSSCGLTLSAPPCTKSDLEELSALTGVDGPLFRQMLQKVGNQNMTRINVCRAAFTAWHDFLRRVRPDIILDGANLGYYGSSSRGGNFFDWKFLNLAVEHCVCNNLSFAVVLHERHLEEKNLKSDLEKAIATKIQNRLFCTPRGFYDDVCMVSSLCSFTKKNLFVVTNDDLRDHVFALEQRPELQRAFRRLCDRRLVRFSARFDKEISQTEFLPEYPPSFSTFLQRNRAVENHALSSWHVPLCRKEGDTSVEWFCFSK